MDHGTSRIDCDLITGYPKISLKPDMKCTTLMLTKIPHICVNDLNVFLCLFCFPNYNSDISLQTDCGTDTMIRNLCTIISSTDLIHAAWRHQLNTGAGCCIKTDDEETLRYNHISACQYKLGLSQVLAGLPLHNRVAQPLPILPTPLC